VDAVVFADTRGSVVDVVQNVGRALRQKPGQGKTARIIVPIFLTPDEDPQDMTTSPQYKPLVAILQALRAYEDKIIEKLVLRRDHTGRGQADEVLADDPQHLRDPGGEQQGQDADAGDRHAEEGSSGGKPGDRALLRFFTPRDAATVVRFLRTRVLQPESVGWLTGYQLLCRWTTEHGHARVPQKERVPLRADGESEELYPLGRWCTEQLRGHRDGTLKAWRFQLLDELGMEWDGSDARFRAKIAVYRRYYEQHHTLAAPLNTIFEDQPVGQDLANLRKPNGLGKKPERAAQRRAMLEAIDPDWKPAWALPWQRHYAKVRWCLTEGGAELPELLPGVRIDGDDLGTWITEQQHTWGALSPTQRDRLARLDIQAPAGTLNAPAARPGPEAVAETAGSAAAATAVAVVPHTANTWDKAMAALRQYRDREGHTRVPRGHREVIHIDHRGSEEDAGAGEVREEHIKLGVFRSNTRARRDRLTPSQRHEAENVGLL
jgi:hypothetical protein